MILKNCVATIALAAAAALSAPALAQQSKVKIVYDQPQRADLRDVAQRLKDRKVLEELQDFLTPLHLPREITVRLAQCNGQRAAYQPQGSIVTICYEVIAEVEKIVAKRTNDQAWRRTLVAGAFIQSALHATAYGIFDVLDIPVWGREFDAADRLAAMIVMQFDEEVSSAAMLGSIQLFSWSDQKWTGSDFASEASPDFQRFYNYACIAVAANYLTFGGLIDRKFIPEYRAKQCEGEYAEIRKAFNLRIMPYVDPDELIKLRTKKWINWSPPK